MATKPPLLRQEGQPAVVVVVVVVVVDSDAVIQHMSMSTPTKD